MDTLSATVYWGSLYNKLLQVLLDAIWWKNHRVNASTLIGAVMLFLSHPYTWATLPQAHNNTRLAWMYVLTLFSCLSYKENSKQLHRSHSCYTRAVVAIHMLHIHLGLQTAMFKQKVNCLLQHYWSCKSIEMFVVDVVYELNHWK